MLLYRKEGMFMHDLLKNRFFIVMAATIIIIIVMGIMSTYSDSAGQIGNILSIPLSPVQKLATYTVNGFESFAAFLKDTRAVKKENEILRERVEKLESENRELQKLYEKNIELSQALRLKGIFDSYILVGGNIIAKEPGNWFDIFTIDAGKKEGVLQDQAVMTANKGLVGRVLNAHYTSSKVLSIIDEDSVVSGWISKAKGGNVRVSGDLLFKKDGLCIMDYIPIDVQVDVGDIIETSGLGGIYPKGIIIGRVIEIRNADDQFKRFAVIKPEVDFKKLDEVFVLTMKYEKE